MDTLSALALASLPVKKDRGDLAAGLHDVDITVRVTGKLSIGAPTVATATCKVSLYGVLARALRSAGCTREAIAALVTEAVAAELRGEVDPDSAALEAAVEALRERFSATLPKLERSGAVSGRALSVAIVSQEVAIAAK